MLREGGTQSFEIALMWDTYILGIQKWGGGGAISFQPFKGGQSRGRMQKSLIPQFSHL